ncbi:hypothetical protein [Mongoliibacter ruber]|nr:hypothetical protein [Mongoliibacter ruber]
MEISYEEGYGKFSIEEAGKFSIWQKGQLFKKTPVDSFRPYVLNVDTEEEVPIRTTLMRAHVNGFSEGRMELFTFDAPVGNFALVLSEGKSINLLEQVAGKITPFQKMGIDKYFIQVRKSVSGLTTFYSILMIFGGGVLVIGGIVFGVLIGKLIG